MHRTALLNLLSAYHPTDPSEVAFKQEMIAFINQNNDCFERTLASGHITASCWLLNKDSSQALLMHHMKLDKWLQLGGHCDGNPDVLQVAVKEAQEESGIEHIAPVHTAIFDIDIHLIPANLREKEHFHYDVRFLLQILSDEHVIQNRESKELRWIDKQSSLLPNHAPSIARMHAKWAALP